MDSAGRAQDYFVNGLDADSDEFSEELDEAEDWEGGPTEKTIIKHSGIICLQIDFQSDWKI